MEEKGLFFPGQLELRFLMESNHIGRGMERSHKAMVSCCRWAALNSETGGWKATGRAESYTEDSKVQLNTWSTNHDLFNPINAWNHIRARYFSMASKKSNTLREENTGMIYAGSPLEDNQFIIAETAASRNHLNLLNGFGLTAEWLGSATWKRPHSTLTEVYHPNKHRLIAALESTSKFCYFSRVMSWKKFKLSTAKT